MSDTKAIPLSTDTTADDIAGLPKPLEQEGSVTFEPDADGNIINLDPSKMPPAKTAEIYPPLKPGEKIAE